MNKKILFIIIIIASLCVAIYLLSFLFNQGTPEEKALAEEMKRKAENSAIHLQEYKNLEDKANQKIKSIIE